MSWEIIGQERALAVLRRAAEDEGRLSHAYLFVGPEHVGKATVARRFAQALNCQAPQRSSSSLPTHPEKLDSGGHPQTPASGAEPLSTPSDRGNSDEQESDSSERRAFDGMRPRLESLGYENEKEGVSEDTERSASGGGEEEAGRPCGECRSCRLIAEDKHPDVEWVRVGGLCDESEHKDHEGSRDIRICQVRRLERVVSRTAFEARYRVIVVDPADALTTEAANAFLKTLEEPPAQVVLVLVTAREEALLETVRSRCRRVAFDGVPREAIASALRERWGAEPAQAERLARLSGGRLGWAVAALTDEKLLEEREEVVEDIESLLAGGYSERFAYAAELAGRYSRNPDAVRATLELWRDWWRDVLLVAAGKHELVADPERLDTLRSYAAQYGVQGALQALAAVSEGREHLEERANPTLALEAMLLELPAAARTGA